MTGLLFGIRLKGRKWDAPFSAFLLCLTVAEGEGPMHRAIGRGSQAVMNRAARQAADRVSRGRDFGKSLGLPLRLCIGQEGI